MSREQLVEMARHEVDNFLANKIDLAPGVYKVPTSAYYDRDRWQLEVDRVFKRLPLALGFSCELKEPGSYRALEVAGVPVLLTRDDEGVARAFVNMCSHRGAIIVDDGCGSAKGFRCPYHAWSYDLEGHLTSVFDNGNFGDIDKTSFGLTSLQCDERAGLLWVVLTPGLKVDIDDFLAGYDSVLGDLNFGDCYVAGRQELKGPNWKVAYDGYRDLYHIPILHKNSFGADAAYRADYFAFGSHMRMTAPKGYAKLADLPEEEWEMKDLVGGVWTIFPNISVAAFDAGGMVYMVSQMYPGANPGESVTTQNFLHTQPPDEEQAAKVAGVMGFLNAVVGGEDYYTGLRIQKALATGAKEFSLFGRNETGGQMFHKWIQALVDTDDAKLPELLVTGV